MIALDYWFLFPIALCISSLAMATGIGGALLFSPILILVLGLDPVTAIGIALITETFGFMSGLYTYGRKKLIDYKLGTKLLVFCIPFSILGTIIATYVPDTSLKVFFGVFIVIIGLLFITHSEKYKKHHVKNNKKHLEYSYDLQTDASFGAFLLGLIGSGLGELMDYVSIIKGHVRSKYAVALSVYMVAVTAFTASIAIILQTISIHGMVGLYEIGSFVVFTIPAVLIGGQIGPRILTHINQHMFKKLLGVVFILVGFVLLVSVFVPAGGL